MSPNVPAGRYKDLDKTYTDNKIAALIDGAPESLDTLNELAQAISDDPTYFTTMLAENTTLQSNIDSLATTAANARVALECVLQSITSICSSSC